MGREKSIYILKSWQSKANHKTAHFDVYFSDKRIKFKSDKSKTYGARE